ncbi:24930_t:CDS:2, partial [Racocetra persica]
ESNNENFDYEISNNDSGDILDEDNVLSEANLLSKGDFLSEDDLLSKGNLSSEDNLLSKGNLSSEDNLLNKEDFNREIVDELLSSEEMPSINREFVLYFSNITEFKNYFVLGFVPFSGSFNEFIGPFVLEMKLLEKGKVIDVQSNKSLVFASLEDVTSDLPQGNDL